MSFERTGRQKGIPTTGPRKILFRSRNEAKWAWFFEMIGWKWVYEPYDFPNYLPDFSLLFDSFEVIVEVKPNIIANELRGYFDRKPAEANSSTSQLQRKPYAILMSNIEDSGLVGLVKISEKIHELYLSKVNNRYLLSYFSGSDLIALSNISEIAAQAYPVKREKKLYEDEEHAFAVWSEAINKSQWIPESRNTGKELKSIKDLEIELGYERGNSVNIFLNEIDGDKSLLNKSIEELYNLYIQYCTKRGLRTEDFFEFRRRLYIQCRR